jgi:hypothetical protein
MRSQPLLELGGQDLGQHKNSWWPAVESAGRP